MKQSILKQAIKIAFDKLDNHPEIDNYPHYTFIIQGNKIIEWSTNSKFEPPKHYGFHRNYDISFRPKYHSEVRAYKRARGIMDLNKPFEIINIRLNKSKKICISKPCKPCHKLMVALGASKFYYSSPIGFLKLV